MKLIKIIGFKPVGNQGVKQKFGLYECPDCHGKFERVISKIKVMKTKRCNLCSVAFKKLCITHGMSKTKIYNVWQQLIQRCTNKNNNRYSNYGGRGITVCKKWLESFEAFYSDMGNVPEKGMQIDREDNNGNYEPSNCRWVTCAKNNRNSSRTKLTEEDVSAIKTILLYGGVTCADIGRMFSVHVHTISEIKYNNNWRDVTPMPI